MNNKKANNGKPREASFRNRGEKRADVTLATRNFQSATQPITRNTQLVLSSATYQDILTEKYYKWLIRIIVCLILSIAVHLCIAYHIHDKVIELVWNFQNVQQEQDEPFQGIIPFPVEPRAISDYGDYSSQDQNAYDEVTPLSTAKEQTQVTQVEQPQTELPDTQIELQPTATPELSDADKLESKPIEYAQAPEENLEPNVDTSIPYEHEIARDSDTIELPEQEIPEAPTQQELPRTQSKHSPLVQTEVVSKKVVLNTDVSDMINQTSKSINIPDESVASTPVSISTPIDWDVGTIVAPTIAQPDLSIRRSSNSVSKAKSNQLATAHQSVSTTKNKSDSQIAMRERKIDDFDSDVLWEFRPTIPDQLESGPTEAYKQRAPSKREEQIVQYGGDKEINQAIENGVRYLSKTQWEDGRWCFHSQPGVMNKNQELVQNGNMQCDTAATALALLSMLGAGYTHQNGIYQEEIYQGLHYLIKQQNTIPVVGNNGKKGAVGALYNAETDTDINARAYAHAMATTALCEAYGMTQDPVLLGPAQAAVRYIIATQNPTRGGWRYETEGREGQPHLETDTSSIGWQVMALRSAVLAKVLSPEEVAPVLSRTQKWLDLARDPKTGLYMYCPFVGVESKFNDWKDVSPAMTAEGMFVQWCISPTKKQSVAGFNYLMKNLPGERGTTKYNRDAYYWYYCTALMFVEGGENWKQWQSHIMPYLKDSQLAGDHPFGGSWDVKRPSIEKWSNLGGKHYLTTMNLMILEVYVRHLSLYRVNAK